MTVSAPARFYFNLRSPYSWLAVHDLTANHPEFASAVEWRPFWEPSEQSEKLLNAASGRFIYTPMTPEKHRYILADVRRLAAARGLSIRWPIDREPHWEVAHLAYLAARQDGLGRQFAVAASRARWEQGLDISDPRQVASIAAQVGLDAERAAGAWQDPGLVELGTRALLDLYDDSVFGVPYFLSGRERFWGVDRLADFVAFAASRHRVPGRQPTAAPGRQSTAAPETEPPADLLDGAEHGHAGGCG
jgi:2-hydroxychromene-2-carboxylate isomerase